jgi:hypothetical protein
MSIGARKVVGVMQQIGKGFVLDKSTVRERHFCWQYYNARDR